MNYIIKKTKKILQKMLPEVLFTWYHYMQAVLASLYYGNPSSQMVVVGITGTKGKTSSSEFTWSVLQASGHKTGLIGTAHILIGDREIRNKIHMTMPSPWITQKYLREMKRSGCTHAVLEVSSEGLKQYRHIGINYDIAVFTNLSPEHLPSHKNSFELYKKAKRVLFEYTSQCMRKPNFLKKVSIVNADSEYGAYYGTVPFDEQRAYSLNEYLKNDLASVVENSITLDGLVCHVVIPGSFNLINALVAYQVGLACGASVIDIKKGIESVHRIIGRMDELCFGQPFRIFVDYAHEKLSMENLLIAATRLKKEGSRIIVLFGAEGGGRDTAKRREMAALADKYADSIILSNVDPYDDPPMEIIEEIASHIQNKIVNENLFLIESRRKGIRQALLLAKTNDIVLLCGKGAETSMTIGGRVESWNEEQVVQEELALIL